MTKHPKIIVVIGPTASGKSEFAVSLAKKYQGEIISADSRQVYRGLDIGTGKIQGQWKEIKNQKSKIKTATSNSKNGTRTIQNSPVYMYRGVPHCCIDYVSPKKQYTVTDFKRDAELAIEDIIQRGKTPIICGGTGLYVDAVLFNQNIPEVKPDPSYRKKLEAKSTAELFALLQKKDPVRAKTIDAHNPRRLIRALEIIQATGKPVPQLHNKLNMSYMTYETIHTHTKLMVEIHYLHPSRVELYKKIEKRLTQRLKEGMVQEVFNLHAKGLSWKRMDELGLEYRYISRYLKILPRASLRGRRLPSDVAISTQFSKSEYHTQLLSEIKRYAKRQETWFKKYEMSKNSL